MSEQPSNWSHLDYDNLDAFRHVLDFSHWKHRADTYGLHPREAELMDLSALRRELDDLIAMRARDAQDELSWTTIGKALGISPQAAAKRYSYRNYRQPSDQIAPKTGDAPQD